MGASSVVVLGHFNFESRAGISRNFSSSSVKLLTIVLVSSTLFSVFCNTCLAPHPTPLLHPPTAFLSRAEQLWQRRSKPGGL